MTIDNISWLFMTFYDSSRPIMTMYDYKYISNKSNKKLLKKF